MLIHIYSFMQAHQAALSAVAVAILDFAIEVHPSLAGNNIISLLMGFFKPKAPPQV